MARSKLEVFATWRGFAARLLVLLALGALVSGCDRCGDFWSPGFCHSDGKPR